MTSQGSDPQADPNFKSSKGARARDNSVTSKPNVIGNADEVMEDSADASLQDYGQKHAVQVANAFKAGFIGKRKNEPKNTMNFKTAVDRFKSKDELYHTLAVRGKFPHPPAHPPALFQPNCTSRRKTAAAWSSWASCSGARKRRCRWTRSWPSRSRIGSTSP